MKNFFRLFVFFLVALSTVAGAKNKMQAAKSDLPPHSSAETSASLWENPLWWVIGILVLVLIIALIAMGRGDKN